MITSVAYIKVSVIAKPVNCTELYTSSIQANSPLQDETNMFSRLILPTKRWKGAGCRCLVKMPSIGRSIQTWNNLNKPATNFSRTRWQSISICLVCSLIIGLWAIRIAAMLLHNIRVDFVNEMCSSLRNLVSQNNSSTEAAILWYSASAVDLETMSCFLDLQATREEPRKIPYPELECRVSRQEPQSESANTWSWSSRGWSKQTLANTSFDLMKNFEKSLMMFTA